MSALILSCTTMQIPAQQSRSTALVVRVGPEVKLIPEQVSVHFLVPADNTADSINQSAAVEAWVRAFPGQRIRLTAVLTSVQGPQGAVPDDAVRWTGSKSSATGGGLAASCSSGTFAAGKAQELVSNWQESGIVACNLTLTLTNALSRFPGEYTGIVTFSVEN